VRAAVAWSLAGLTAAFAVADVFVASAYQSLLSEAAVAQHGFPFVELAVLGSAVLGAVIVSRSPRHPVGVLLILVGVTGAFSLLAESYSIWVIDAGGPGSRSMGGVAGWVSSLFGGQLALGGLALMFLLAPDGHFLSRRWRVVGWCLAVGELCSFAAVVSMKPTQFDLSVDEVGPVRQWLLAVGFLSVAFGLVAAVVSMVVRLRRSQGEERQQLRLIALGVILVAIGVVNLLTVQSLNGGRQTWAASLPLLISYVLMPVCLAVAVLRYRLYEIDVLVNWTVVLAVGSAFAAAGYVTLVVTVGRLVDSRTSGFWLSLLATAVVALAFQPLRRAVDRLANRLAYGARAQPYEALSDFSRRLAETPLPSTLLPAVAEASGRAVAARHASASLLGSGAGEVAASWGDELSEAMGVHVVPVRNEGHLLGNIVVGVDRNRPWRPSDERLLTALAEQAAIAFRNTALETSLAAQVVELDRTTRELSESRSRIIDAEDAARRLLENAVSREVLPHLVSLPRQLRRAREAVQQGAAENGLEALVVGTNTALESLRELTRGVFPTQLARVGLEPALRSLVARSAPGASLEVDATAADHRFSARIEAAVYFCCAETARTGLSSIKLSLVGEDLLLEVGHDSGTPTDLQSQIDRVEAAGGWLSSDTGLLRCVIPVGQGDPPNKLLAAASGGVGPDR
jgi:GAF domain-containing protein